MAGYDHAVSLRRKAVPPQARSQSRLRPLPAPVIGWVSAQNQSQAKPGSAIRLENWFPTQTGIRLIGGSLKHATGSATEPVESLMAYVGETRKLLCGVDGGILDITTPADPDVAPAAAVSGQTSNYYSSVNYATAGGFYMYMVNGTDKPRLFDGTTYTAIDGVSTPAMTGFSGGTVTSDLSQVNAYRNRLYFVEGGSLNVYATEADSLGGTMVQLSLSGVAKKGGSVLFTATWSLDAGDGLDDKLVVVTTEGEVAVYQGSDPADATTWSLVGLYDCPRPLGKNGFMRAGGDLVILTEQGAVPVSQIIVKDPAALALAAISKAIQPDWMTDAAARSTANWEIVKWPSHSMAIISMPIISEGQTAQCYIVNIETGAWCKRVGWDAQCFALHDDQVYFGTADGMVMAADRTGYDNAANYECVAIFAWDHLGAVSFEKTVVSARAQFVASTTFNPQISISTNYIVDLPTPPGVYPDTDLVDVWDTGLWDEAMWDSSGTSMPVNTRWVSIGQSGYVVAPQIQVTVGTSATPDVELAILDLLVEQGEVMV